MDHPLSQEDFQIFLKGFHQALCDERYNGVPPYKESLETFKNHQLLADLFSKPMCLYCAAIGDYDNIVGSMLCDFVIKRGEPGMELSFYHKLVHEVPLSDMPLYVNHEDFVARLVSQFRMQIGK